MGKFIKKIFGGIEMTWAKIVILAVALGIWTALMALLLPENNSFHDIVATAEWWVLPAMIIIANCKKPLDAAAKTFVFFLISQPLIYLIQVPFNQMGWNLFKYYPYWFGFTLATAPAAFICWFIHKDQWYSGIILAAVTSFLGLSALSFFGRCADNFPSHLITIIYCFATIILYIFALSKKIAPRIICAAITAVIIAILAFQIAGDQPYETYRNAILEENNITLVGDAYISEWSSEKGKGNVEIIKHDDGYTFKISGKGTSKYYFTVSDGENEYRFEYYFNKDQNAVVVNRL